MRKQTVIFITALLFTGRLVAQTSPWDDPSEIKRIESNIEKYRKGDAALTVVDKNGKPVANATVVIQQKTHEFKFGCNLFALHQLPTPELNSKYESAFTSLFNFATIPFYWEGLEPQKDSLRFKEGSAPIWRRPPPDEMVKWCKDHNILIKGHPMLYIKSKFLPSWIPKNDPEGLKSLAAKHMAQLSERYGDDVAIWDVVNEEVARLKNPKVWHAAPKDYLAWAFQKADSLFPARTKLLINDETITSHDSTQEYVDMVAGLLRRNIRVDGIGIQFHMHYAEKFLKGEYFPPAKMHEAYQKLSVFNKPLWVTEITIHGTGENGPRKQGKIVENIYKLWFSEPNMKGITWWNFADGTAYNTENASLGGILDSNMNPKPAYVALDRLINHEWRTNVTLKTDANGIVKFRGFHGGYSVKATTAGQKSAAAQSFELSSGNQLNKATIVL